MFDVFPSPFPPAFASPFSQSPAPAQVPAPQVSEQMLPRYVNYIGDTQGCAFWRILWPEMLINMSGIAFSQSQTCMVPDAEYYRGVKAVRVQRQASTQQKGFIEHLKRVQQIHNFKLIYEVDDVVFHECIPDYNKFKFAFNSDEIRQNCIDIMNMCDEVTVTCPYMQQLYKEKTGKKEITVVPNFIPQFWMGNMYNKAKVYSNLDTHRRKPRILYTGSGAHYDVENRNGGIDDFSHVLKAVIDTRHKYQWVLVGSFPPGLEQYVRDQSIEFHDWQSLLNYPSLIASLDANLTIAPLQDNEFNRSKSDIKFIESSALGIPCLMQRMETYKDAPEYLKFSTGEEFLEKIETILKSKKQYYQNVDALRAVAEQRFLERPENINCHMEILNTPYGHPSRQFLRRFNS